LTAGTLAALGLAHIPVERIRPMDSVASIAELAEVGQAIAEVQVQADHFAGF